MLYFIRYALAVAVSVAVTPGVSSKMMVFAFSLVLWVITEPLRELTSKEQ